MKKVLTAFFIPLFITCTLLNSPKAHATNLGESKISVESLSAVIGMTTLSSVIVFGLFLAGSGFDGNTCHPGNIASNLTNSIFLATIASLAIYTMATQATNRSATIALSSFLFIDSFFAYLMFKNLLHEAWYAWFRYSGVYTPQWIEIKNNHENIDLEQQQEKQMHWVLAPDARLKSMQTISRLLEKASGKAESEEDLRPILADYLRSDLETEFFATTRAKGITQIIEEKENCESHEVRKLRRQLKREFEIFLLKKIGEVELALRLEDKKASRCCQSSDETEAHRILRAQLKDESPALRKTIAISTVLISLIPLLFGTNGLYTSIAGFVSGNSEGGI